MFIYLKKLIAANLVLSIVFIIITAARAFAGIYEITVLEQLVNAASSSKTTVSFYIILLAAMCLVSYISDSLKVFLKKALQLRFEKK